MCVCAEGEGRKRKTDDASKWSVEANAAADACSRQQLHYDWNLHGMSTTVVNSGECSTNMLVHVSLRVCLCAAVRAVSKETRGKRERERERVDASSTVTRDAIRSSWRVKGAMDTRFKVRR